MQEEERKEEDSRIAEADNLGSLQLLGTAFRLLVLVILLTSVTYTFFLTGAGNLLWGKRSRGDLVRLDGKVVGSRLIGQEFTGPKYFHSRPSSKNYDAMDSGSANLAPTNEELTERVRARVNELKERGIPKSEVPVSYVTESGSALDPHITPAGARLQVPRVSDATGISEEKLKDLIAGLTRGKFLGLYGKRRVNVLSLNLKLKELMETGHDD